MGQRPVANLVLTASRLRFGEASIEAVKPSQIAAARRAIAQENHAAALGVDDTRWLFARYVQESIEGGRAAIMRPQIRQRLVTQASKMGLRPFDANLVIAIVQDAARHGENLDETAASRLAVIPGARAANPIGPLMLLGAAVGLGAGLLALLIAWLMG